MKKHLWLVLALVLALAVAIPALAGQGISIFVDGQELKSDVPAQLIEDRTMVPLRAIAENFGKEVDWDGDTQTVTIEGNTEMDTVAAISAQWATTGHASTDRPLNYAGGRDGCQPCHSGNGFETFLSDAPYQPDAFIPMWAHGENSKDSDQLPRAIDCAACHSALGQELIDSDIAKAELVPFADEDFEAPNSALCLSCHNGRRNPAELYDQAAAGEISGSYPHNDVGALFTGMGGMEYPDLTYKSSTAHKTQGCVSCHMPETEAGFKSHDFGMEIEYIDVTCSKCHGAVDDFTVGGNLQAELDDLLAELEELALASVDGAVEIGLHHGEFPYLDAEGNVINDERVSLEAFVAAYNYALIATDKSGGAHNPQYAISLLENSIEKLK